MIPYIQIDPIEIGPLVLQPFGLLVLAGCVAGALVARREARLRGLDPEAIDGSLFWALVPGFFMSRLFELAFYHPEDLVARPWSVFYFWETMSSFGGFLGGTLGVIGYFRYTNRAVMPHLESLLAGFIVGWFFGRLGCTIVHDHPGLHSHFFLAVRFPDGPRHDLGFYEWLFTIVIATVVFSIDRFRLPSGMLLGAVCVAYAPVRFLLDSLRTADRTYFGLTPGQYSSAILLALGFWLMTSSLRKDQQVSST